MRVVICGAGIAGLCLAWCLERAGHQVVVVEQSPHLRDDGYMMDFLGSGYDASERLGLLEDLASIHDPVDRFTIVDAAGRERVSLPYSLLRKRLFGNRHFNFMRGELVRLLARRVEGHVDLRLGTTIASIQQRTSSAAVTLTDDTVHEVDLLVGSDGVHSLVRRLVFGAESQYVRFLGDRAAAFVIDHPSSSLDPGGAVVTMTVPNRQVTIYPVRGARVATFFLHRVGDDVRARQKSSACGELQAVYGDLGWRVPELLSRCSSAGPVYFDDVQQIRMPSWCAGRVVLIGDACQCVSPVVGQGASMAVAAAHVLADELSRTTNVQSALQAYERRLKPAIERQQAAGQRLAKWFVPADAFRLRIRNLVTEMSAWPVVAAVLRHRMAAESLF